MARTIATIQAEILAYKTSRTELDVFQGASNTAIWRAWVYIQSLLIYTIECIFDSHRADVQSLIDEKKPHRPNWYTNKVLAYQHGMDLIADTDTYDNTGLTDEEIEALRVVKYSKTIDSGSQVIIKVAGETNGERNVLTAGQAAGLLAYIAEIKDAGVPITLINEVADYYRAAFDIYYDPMILNGQGARLDGTNNTPVQTAIKNYIKNLPFNGEYSNVGVVDELQKIPGVIIPELLTSETKYGLHDWSTINAKVIPDSGYLKVYNDADLTLNFIAYEASN
jgi:hypothetical protein